MDSRGRLITGIVIIVIIAIIVLLCLAFAPRASKAELTAPRSVEITYGEIIDLSQFKIDSYSSFGYSRGSKTVTAEMIKYNPENIGTQDATFTYKQKKIQFKITIKPAKMDTPQISYSNGIVRWNNIEKVEKYVVNINNIEYDTEVNSFDMTSLQLPTGELSVKVMAVSSTDKYIDSNYSDALQIKKLAAVSSISYEGGKLIWDNVEGASKYNLTVNGKSVTSDKNSLDYSNFIVGENTVEIYAVGDENNTVKSQAYKDVLTKLSAVTNVRYVGGKILWDSAYSNCTYKITIDGEVYNASQKFLEKELEVGVSYSVKIVVISNEKNVIQSDEAGEILYFDKLAAPQASIFLGDYSNTYNVKIKQVENADTYVLTVTLFSGEDANTKTYTITSLETQIEVDGSVTKIQVTVTAKDSTGEFADSEEYTTQREINN